MDSILESAEKATDKEINRVRWALGINGVLSLAFGVVIIVWPGISLRALTIVFGVYAAISGVVALSGVLSGLVRILFGIVMFAQPSGGALILLALIAAFALVRGAAELVVAIGGKRLFERDIKRAAQRVKIGR